MMCSGTLDMSEATLFLSPPRPLSTKNKTKPATTVLPLSKTVNSHSSKIFRPKPLRNPWHFTYSILANLGSSTFKIYPECDHFLPLTLLSLYSKSPSSLPGLSLCEVYPYAWWEWMMLKHYCTDKTGALKRICNPHSDLPGTLGLTSSLKNNPVSSNQSPETCILCGVEQVI